LRIDAHHSFSARYPLDHLEIILARNRFEGSLVAGPPVDAPDFVRGFIVPADAFRAHPRICAVQVSRLSDLDMLPPHLPLDLLHLLPHLPEIAARFPGRPLALDYLGAPAGPDWPRLMEAAAQIPQVCCKLSGLAMFSEPRDYVQHALRLFGPRRLMFGSDWPNGLPQLSWKASLALFTQSIGAQSIETREELLGGTAARFYGI
jgi:predicted TIM-barrel fold metal-dependent hydrolase